MDATVQPLWVLHYKACIWTMLKINGFVVEDIYILTHQLSWKTLKK